MTADQIAARLAEPFDPAEVKWKPTVIKGDRALVMPYVTARAVMDRLDAAFGVDGWEDAYTPQADGTVVCRLAVWFDGRSVSKSDVGSPSEQPDEGDRMKAAFSDALKRAAVKFGVGRYLYRLPAQWVDYDPTKKQIIKPPTLPGAGSRRQNAKAPDPTGEDARAKAAAAARKSLRAAQTLDELQAAWKVAAPLCKVRDQHTVELAALKDARKLEIALDEIDTVANDLELDVVAIAKLAASVNVTDIDAMAADEAVKVLENLRDQAEAARVTGQL